MPRLCLLVTAYFAGGSTLGSAVIEEREDGRGAVKHLDGDPGVLLSGLGLAGVTLEAAYPEAASSDPTAIPVPEPEPDPLAAEEAELLAKLEEVKALRARDVQRKAVEAALVAEDERPSSPPPGTMIEGPRGEELRKVHAVNTARAAFEHLLAAFGGGK